MARRVSFLRSLLFSQHLLSRNPNPSLHRHAVAVAVAACGGPSPPSSVPPPPLRSDDRRFFLSSSSCRSFASSPEASKIQLLGSADQFNDALAKIKDENLPAVFYFTAVWCGPCRFISPTIEELSKKYPNVMTYKIDIDQEGLGTILNQLHIYSVPTLHFYHDGKRAAEVVGADVERLKETMESLYK